MSNDLKPCPFCGCDDNVWLVDPDDGDLFKFVTCNRCDTRGPEKFVAAEAIAAWNRRAPSPDVEGIAEEIWQAVTAAGSNDILMDWPDADVEEYVKGQLRAILTRALSDPPKGAN